MLVVSESAVSVRTGRIEVRDQQSVYTFWQGGLWGEGVPADWHGQPGGDNMSRKLIEGAEGAKSGRIVRGWRPARGAGVDCGEPADAVQAIQVRRDAAAPFFVGGAASSDASRRQLLTAAPPIRWRAARR